MSRRRWNVDSQNNDFLKDLGAEAVQDDFSDLGAEAVSQPAEPGLGEKVMQAAETAMPNAVPIAKELGKRIFSNAKEIEANPMMQTLDPAAKAGFVLQNTMQGVFDEGGELTATRLASAGVNPYLAAAAGTVVAEIPDIVFSAEGIAAIRAAGNARAESEILSKLMKKNNPLALEYKTAIPTPTTVVESGPAIPLESKAQGLLKGSKPLALPEPKSIEGPGFSMREKPDMAKIQESDLIPRSEISKTKTKLDILDVQPAYKDSTGKIHSPGKGYQHAEIIDELEEKGVKFGKFNPQGYGFLDKKSGKFYKQEEISKILGIPENEGLTAHELAGIQQKFTSDPRTKELYKAYRENDFETGELLKKFIRGKPREYEQELESITKSGIKRTTVESGQPKYPEDIGNTSMRGYAGRKRLSADVPEFSQIEKSVAPADRYNPAVSELVDESRKQYVGVDPRLEVVKDMQTGKTTFRLKRDPQIENRVVTEAEHASNTATKNSAAVNEMALDPRIVDSSPVLPGSETIPVIKEGIVAGSRSWMQDAWNRIGVAAEDVISRMGDAGKQMANGIRTMRDVPQVRYGEFSAGFDKFLKGTSKKEAKEISIALSDALEGRTPKTKLPEGMLEFVQQKLKVIADEAEAIGLQVRNSSGEVVPFAARENYFPRVLRQEIFDALISGDNKVMREIAQKMVANKQQSNFQMAFERVKYMRNKMISNKYGHLERAREVELPPELYDRNSLRVIPEYINSALHRIEEVRQFGLEGERALEMLNMMQQQGHDAKLARTIYERFTRIEPRDNVYLRGAQGLRNITAGMLIQAQSTVLQLGQAMMPAYEAGVFNAIKGFAKSFTELGAAEAKRAGQVFNIAAEEYMKEAYGSGSYGFGSKFVDGVFKMTGFTRMDHFLRKYAALTAKEYIPSLVKKLINNPSSKTARVELENLGYDTAQILRNKGITTEQLNVGAKRFADMTQGAPDVTRLPEFWTRPEGKLFGQFKNFSYLIGKQNASMIKRALQTGNVVRLGEMAVGLPMTGYVISELRKAMVGESQYEITGNEEVDKVIEILGSATAFGPSMDLFFQALQGPQNLKNFIIPTSISNALEIVGSAGKALKEGDTENLAKTLLKKTPVVGRILENQVYGD